MTNSHSSSAVVNSSSILEKDQTKASNINKEPFVSKVEFPPKKDGANNTNIEKVTSIESEKNNTIDVKNKNQTNTSLRAELPLEKEFKLSGSIFVAKEQMRALYNNTLSKNKETERKDLTNLMVNNLDSFNKLISLSGKDVEPKIIRLAENLKKYGTTFPIRPDAERALINFLKDSANKLSKIDPKVGAELGAILETINKNDLITVIDQREEKQEKFEHAVDATFGVARKIESKINDIRKTDPDTAKFLECLTRDFEKYKKNPALFMIYGQYMKNVLNMIEAGKLDELKDFDAKFQKVFKEIKDTMKSSNKMSEEEKKAKILDIINSNKDFINYDITSYNNRGQNTNVNICEILNDMFSHPEFYVKDEDSTSTDASGGGKSDEGSSEEKTLLPPPRYTKVELERTQLGVPQLDGKKPTPSPVPTIVLNKPLTKLTTFDDDDTEINTTEKSKSSGGKTETKPTASSFIQNLNTNSLKKMQQTFSKYKVDKDIKDFSSKFDQVKESGIEYVKANNEYINIKNKLYEEINKIIEVLNKQIEDNIKAISEILDIDPALESAKEELNKIIEEANEKESLIGNMDFNLNNEVTSGVALLEKFREIIVDLDLGLRAIKNRVEDKVKIDIDFMKEANKLAKNKEKAIKAIRNLENNLKNSKENQTKNLSSVAQKAIFRSDLKMIGLVMQELMANKISVGLE